MTTEFIESQPQVPETPFERTKIRVLYRCAACGHQWKSRPVFAAPKNDPPCPNTHCSEMRLLRQHSLEIANLKRMLAEQHGPATVGANPVVQAVDKTAGIVMQDYGMTDLKDNIREGESMAPKLPPVQQKQADGYFGGQKDMKAPVWLDKNRMRTIKANQLESIKSAALRGAYRGLAVPPMAVIPKDMRNLSPLRKVRDEPLGVGVGVRR